MMQPSGTNTTANAMAKGASAIAAATMNAISPMRSTLPIGRRITMPRSEPRSCGCASVCELVDSIALVARSLKADVVNIREDFLSAFFAIPWVWFSHLIFLRRGTALCFQDFLNEVGSGSYRNPLIGPIVPTRYGASFYQMAKRALQFLYPLFSDNRFSHNSGGV